MMLGIGQSDLSAQRIAWRLAARDAARLWASRSLLRARPAGAIFGNPSTISV